MHETLSSLNKDKHIESTDILLSLCIAGILLCNGFGLIQQTILTIALEVLMVLTIRKKLNEHDYTLNSPVKPIHIAIAFLTLLALTRSIIQSDNLSLSLVQALRLTAVIMHLILFIHLANYLQKSGSFIPIALQIVAITCSLIALSNFYISITDQTYTAEFEPVFGKNIRHLGFIASVALIVSCCSLAYARTTFNKKAFFVINFILSLSFLIWLGGRASILIAAVIITLIIIHSFIASQKNIVTPRLIVLTVIATVIFEANIETHSWNGINRLLLTDSGKEEVINVDQVSSGRLSMWTDAWAEIKQAPLIGHGPDGYLIATSSEVQVYAHPHNLFLQYIYNYGFITTALFFFLLLVLTVKFIKKAFLSTPPNEQSIASILIIISLFLNSLTSGTLYYPHSLMMLAVAFSYYFVMPENNHV